jgi:diguanylate cyclase (GGDEF)-like protein
MRRIMTTAPKDGLSACPAREEAPLGEQTPDVPGMELGVELGHGRDTTVFRARRTGDGDEEYAVKLLTTPGDGVRATSFRREAALLASLDHPALPRIFQVGQVGTRPYLVMELIEGHSLADRLRDGPAAEEEAARIAAQVAGGLSAVHRAGLVHRDVTPHNIMIDEKGAARLVDFDLAGRASAGTAERVVSSFAYTAPEQSGMLHRPVDGRSDLYSLGVVLYEALTGGPPFAGDDPGDLIRRHATQPARDVLTVRPGLGPGIARIVAALLAKDPDDRYQDAAALARDLARSVTAGVEDFPLRRTALPERAATPLVGRSRDLARLTARWERARAGAGGAALLYGPAGCGRTRLAGELARLAADPCLPRVLSGRCPADSPTPLAPVRAALEGFLTGHHLLDDADRRAALSRVRQAVGDAAPAVAGFSPALDTVLGLPPVTGATWSEQLAEALATVLVALADLTGGLLVHIDDLERADTATLWMLNRLADRLGGSRVLVIATATADHGARPAEGGDPADGPADVTLPGGLDATFDLRLPVGPLDDTSVAQVIADALGTTAAPDDVVLRLARRAGGAPLAALELVRAALDTGLLTPSWGTWVLDAGELEELPLPDSVIDLVLRRVDALSETARGVLTVAATVGSAVTVDLVARVCRQDSATVADALDEAVLNRLVEPVGGGYDVLHERVRQALLSRQTPHRRRMLHQRVAEELDRADPTDPDTVYAVARHYLAGEPGRTPEKAFRAVCAAGALALAHQSCDDALRLLESAASIASSTGLVPGPAFHAHLGAAASRTGDYPLAHHHLALAVAGERDTLRRARLYGETAETYHLQWQGEAALEVVRRGLAEIGRPLPRRTAPLVASTLAWFAAGVVVGRLPAAGRLARAADRQRVTTWSYLIGLAAESAAMANRPALMVACALRELYPANRLGPGPEYVIQRASLAITATALGLRPTGRRLLARAAAALPRGDASLRARLQFLRGGAMDIFDTSPADPARTGHEMRWALAEHGHWLSMRDYLTGAGMLGQVLLLRGHHREAADWYRRALSRTSTEQVLLGNAVATVGPRAAALAGDHREAAEQLQRVRDFLVTVPDHRTQRLCVAVAAVQLAVEEGSTSGAFDAALAEFAALGVPVSQLWTIHRAVWVYETFGWLDRAAAAPPDRRQEALAAATRAAAKLGRRGNHPLLTAYHAVALASVDELSGHPDGALRRLARCEAGSAGLDMPLLAYETAWVRARAYRSMGRRGDATCQAGFAASVASSNGWRTRLRRVADEFCLERAGGQISICAVSEELHRRRLEAVRRISLTASSVLDPERLVRVTLTEILTILAAERAFLFLRAADGDRLEPYLGRDRGRGDLTEITDYGAALVTRVWETGKGAVVTDGDGSGDLGPSSGLVHGLRSVMAAPLFLHGRPVGVVYLDSRVARGVFGPDDLDLLTAIGTQVVLALQTARAAQLELAVQAAEQQRDLAESLHEAMASLVATLDPLEVADRLLTALGRMMRVDAAVLLHRQDPRRELTALAWRAPEGMSCPRDPAGDAVVRRLLTATAPRHALAGQETVPLPGLLGARSAWMAVPLIARGQHRGLVLLGRSGGGYSEAEIQIGAAMAGQGITALDNALLFHQVREHATHDELTGLWNRRHFDRLAAEPHGGVQGVRGVALMVDIDHFKKINDTYGHHAGDEVIRHVADRLARGLREIDLICRFGGEEFAILLRDVSCDQAVSTGERLRAAIAGTPTVVNGTAISCTVSIGVSGGARGDLHALLTTADNALYAAKRSGRNRVALAASP